MASVFLQLLLKVFAFVLLGRVFYGLLRRGGAHVVAEKVLVGAVYYVAVPLFIVISVVQISADFSKIWKIIAAACFVAASGFAAAAVFARLTGREYRTTALPVAIMNSAYLAIPVNTVLFGPPGAFWSVIYNVTVTVVHFTAGPVILRRPGSGGFAGDLPAVWALAAGFLLRWFLADSAAAVFLRDGYKIFSSVVLPAMLFFLGVKTASIGARFPRRAAYAAALRIGAGFLFGVLAVKIFSLDGAAAAVCVMTSSMPAAVNTYIMAKKFDADEDFAAAAVLIGTASAAITVPCVLLAVKWLGYF